MKTPANPPGDIANTDLVGAFHLVSYEHVLESGGPALPLGPGATGQLIYTPEGRMSAALMRAGRPLSPGVGPFDGTDGELAEAARGYLSYAGRYELRPGRVLHHIELCLVARWVNTTQERLLSWEDGRLVLATPPFSIGGVSQVARLVWARSSA